MRFAAPTILIVSLVAPASASPPAEWTNGHWYRVIDGPCLGWHEARAAAEAAGGHLATIGSSDENHFVRGLSNHFAIWIGLFQDPDAPDFAEPAGGWRWITGEPLSFTNWWVDEPNEINKGEDFGHLNAPWLADGQWNDHRPEGCFAYAIEWDADCTGDGLVDFGQILAGEFRDTNGNGVPDCCDSGTPCDESCPGDVTGNGQVNPVDLTALLVDWGTAGGREFETDCNEDGIVDADDLAIVLADWGPCS